jgi:thioredoxin reductase
VAYGHAFQERFVRNLEKKNIMSIDRAAGGFLLRASDGEELIAKQVVIATGIGRFGFIPPELSNLPPDLLTHSVHLVDFKQFDGRNVIVIGAGASAMDAAAALRRHGANITVVARTPEVRFSPPIPARQNIVKNLFKPVNPLGVGWKGVLCVKGPLLFHTLPEALRVHVVKTFLGPAPGWFVREELEGRVPFVLGTTITGAQVENGRPQLTLRLRNEQTKCLSADHIVAGTGFRVDVRRLNMLSSEIKNGLRRVDQAPALTRDFESSIPGLYFVGTASANSFGPYMRFVAGTGFSSRRVSKRIAQRIEQTSVARAALAYV